MMAQQSFKRQGSGSSRAGTWRLKMVMRMDSRRRIPRREPAAVASSEAVCLDSLLDRAGPNCSCCAGTDRSVITCGWIANAHGCKVDEGSVHPCIINGKDYGQLLYTLGVLGWLMLALSPLGRWLSRFG